MRADRVIGVKRIVAHPDSKHEMTRGKLERLLHLALPLLSGVGRVLFGMNDCEQTVAVTRGHRQCKHRACCEGSHRHTEFIVAAQLPKQNAARRRKSQKAASREGDDDSHREHKGTDQIEHSPRSFAREREHNRERQQEIESHRQIVGIAEDAADRAFDSDAYTLNSRRELSFYKFLDTSGGNAGADMGENIERPNT